MDDPGEQMEPISIYDYSCLEKSKPTSIRLIWQVFLSGIWAYGALALCASLFISLIYIHKHRFWESRWSGVYFRPMFALPKSVLFIDDEILIFS